MNNIPEEIEAMAYLIGQSNQIDQMMVERPSTLVTSTHTLKQGLNNYVQAQRAQQAQQAPSPQYYQPQPIHSPVPMPPVVPLPYIVPPQAPQKENDGQLEFNLEPTKLEEMVMLLKEISQKLTKQNNLLEKVYANSPKQKTVSEPVVKLVPNT
jgi:hypothetical protein